MLEELSILDVSELELEVSLESCKDLSSLLFLTEAFLLVEDLAVEVALELLLLLEKAAVTGAISTNNIKNLKYFFKYISFFY